MNKTITLVSILVALGLGAFVWIHGCQNPLRVPIVRQQKLAEVRNIVEKGRFACPPRSIRQTILVALPASGMAKQDLAGTIKIDRAGTNLLTLQITPATLVNCNWLDRHGLTACIIENPANADKWNLALEPDAEYDMEIQGVPPGVGIWLHYVRPSGWDFGFR